MNELLAGLLGILISSNQATALSNVVAQATGHQMEVANLGDPVEREYLKLLADDNAAQEEVDRWIRENQAFKEKGAGILEATLALRVEQRLEPVRKAYEDFLSRHPKHVRARLAFGSFLHDTGQELEAVQQWEKAREIDPKNPATWNNLAHYYGHRGPVTNAFACYAKAIELVPDEPVYYQNLAIITFLYRKDAMEFYGINEQQVFDRSLELYRKALKMDPDNFVLASELAQTYYGIRPARYQEAIDAWKYALQLANDDVKREGVYLHLARLKLNTGQFEEARQHLNQVTNPVYQTLKQRISRNLEEKLNPAKSPSQNNSPAGAP